MNLISKDRVSATRGAASVAEPAPAASAAADPSWRWALGGIAVSIVALLALFWEAAWHTVYIWATSPTFNHGFLILPIVGYLAWRRREALMARPPEPWLPGLALVALAGLGWLAGAAADVLMIQQFALVGLIQATVLTVVGRRAGRVLAFPLFYLIFAVPFGKMLVPHLQDVTAYLAVGLLRGIGIPVFAEGVFLSIPTGNFHVAEVCSGIRFLIATIAFAMLYSHVTYRTLWRRALFIGLAFIVPVLANGVRAFGIIYLAHVTDNRLAVGVDHLIYGWIFFALVTIVMILLGQTFRERDREPEDRSMPGAGVKPPEARKVALAAGLALAVAAAAPSYADFMDRGSVVAVTAPLALPETVGGWHRAEPAGRPWRPKVKGADAEAIATYEKGGRTVTLFVAYFSHQRQGAEAVGARTRIIGGHDWSRVSAGTRQAVLGGKAVAVTATRILARPDNRMVWHWYWIGGAFTADRLRAKLLDARAKLFGGTRAGAAIAVSAEFAELPEEAEAALRDFVAGLGGLRGRLGQFAAAAP